MARSEKHRGPGVTDEDLWATARAVTAAYVYAETEEDERQVMVMARGLVAREGETAARYLLLAAERFDDWWGPPWTV